MTSRAVRRRHAVLVLGAAVILAAHSFAWGGLFLRPHGAHFQWAVQ